MNAVYPEHSRERPSRLDTLGLDLPGKVITETVRSLTTHASVRGFKTDPLPEGALQALLTAGISASTSSNMHAYSIIVVTDPGKKRHLAELSGNQKHVEQCPAFVVFCPDVHRLKKVTARQGYSFEANNLEMFLVAVVDAALVCENVTVAAESMGLGAVMIGAIRNHPEKVHELLGLPNGVFALVGLCIGYPDGDYPNLKPRMPLDVLVHHDGYHDDGLEAGLDDYDQIMVDTGIYDGRHVQVPGAVDEERLYSWQEHTARRLARKHPTREQLMQTLTELGFDIR